MCRKKYIRVCSAAPSISDSQDHVMSLLLPCCQALNSSGRLQHFTSWCCGSCAHAAPSWIKTFSHSIFAILSCFLPLLTPSLPFIQFKIKSKIYKVGGYYTKSSTYRKTSCSNVKQNIRLTHHRKIITIFHSLGLALSWKKTCCIELMKNEAIFYRLVIVTKSNESVHTTNSIFRCTSKE